MRAVKSERKCEKNEMEAYNGYSQTVTHPTTNLARQGLTPVVGLQ